MRRGTVAMRGDAFLINGVAVRLSAARHHGCRSSGRCLDGIAPARRLRAGPSSLAPADREKTCSPRHLFDVLTKCYCRHADVNSSDEKMVCAIAGASAGDTGVKQFRSLQGLGPAASVRSQSTVRTLSGRHCLQY